MWDIGPVRGGARSGSVMWADKYELLIDPYIGINQVVGHTPSLYPEIRRTKHKDLIHFVDVIQRNGKDPGSLMLSI